MNWATKLYNNPKILTGTIPSYYEQHNTGQSLLLKKNKIEFFPSGKFQNTIKKLNFLYLEEKERLENILHQIRKDVIGLNFDEIVLPTEDIFAYFQLKEKNKKIIKKNKRTNSYRSQQFRRSSNKLLWRNRYGVSHSGHSKSLRKICRSIQ